MRRNLAGTVRSLLYRHSDINWALADQTLVSGVNFVSGILLARYLGLKGFGGYTLAWMAVQFTMSLQYAMVISPMMSIGPKRSADEARSYFSSVTGQQIIFGFASCGLLLLGIWKSALFFPDWRLEHLAIPLACSALGFQTQDYLRRYLFTRGKPRAAFINDIVKYGGQILLLFWICFQGQASIANALWVIVATSFLAAILGLAQIERPAWPGAACFKDTCVSHFRFAKWLAGSVIVRWTARNLFVIAAGAILGASAAGALKAAQNMLGVTHIMFKGLENAIPVKASKIYVASGFQGLTRYLGKVATLVGGGTVVIALVFAIPAEFWLVLFYGDAFAAYAGLVRWYAAIYVITAMTLPLQIGLRAVEKTSPIFWSWASVSLFSLATSACLVHWLGINGAALGILASVTLQVCILTVGFFGTKWMGTYGTLRTPHAPLEEEAA